MGTNGNDAAGTSTRTFSQMVSSGTSSNNNSRNGKGQLFTACKAVKQVKSGLVMGLTGEVNMIDWSALLISELNMATSSYGNQTTEDRVSREREKDCLRTMISFLSSNISSRSDCTQLFSFIVKKE